MNKTRKPSHGHKKKDNRSPVAVAAALSSKAREWLDEASKSLQEGSGTASEDSRLVEALSQLPAPDSAAVVRQLAKDTGELALPLIQYMTTVGEPSLSLAATDALGLIPELDAAAILGGLQRATSDKALRKTARKSLMRLKSLGLEVDDFLEATGETFDVSQLTPDTASGWVSNVDGAGNQMVIFSKSVPLEGPYVMHVITNDKLGIEACMGGRSSRSQVKLFIEQLEAEGEVHIVSVDPDYARHIIRTAQSLNEVTHTPLPQDYLSISFLLGDADDSFTVPDVYSLLQFDSATIGAEDVANSAKVLESADFKSWSLPHDTTHKYVDEIREIEAGWVVTSQDVKKDRFISLLKSATDFVFSMGERQLFKGRLERMAYYLYLKGNEDLARESLKVGAIMVNESLEAQDIPFARHFVARSIVMDIEAHKEGGLPAEETPEEEKKIEIPNETVDILRASYGGK